MTITTEFAISLVIQLLILAFFIGIYVSTIRFMKEQIEDIKTNLKNDKHELKENMKIDKQELKEEMRKYNSVLERMIICEQSTKSAHKRIDDIIDENK